MSVLIWIAAYLALGAFTGFFAGMLGIGGGLVMVPALTLMFAAQAQFPAAEVLHLALGTSMASIIFTALASLKTHHSHGAVMWPVFKVITPGILLGTAIGTVFAASVPARPLAVFFTFFVCLIAVQMALTSSPRQPASCRGRSASRRSALGLVLFPRWLLSVVVRSPCRS